MTGFPSEHSLQLRMHASKEKAFLFLFREDRTKRVPGCKAEFLSSRHRILSRVPFAGPRILKWLAAAKLPRLQVQVAGPTCARAPGLEVSWLSQVLRALSGQKDPATRADLIGDKYRGTFLILSRDPSFQETIKDPGETAGV